MALITASGLKKRFNLEAGFFAGYGRYVQAVNGLDFTINKNESYGLVGESGCGKTTTARLLVRMYEPDEGKIIFQSQGGGTSESNPLEEVDVGALKKNELKKYREKVKYVFQDPARSLNPRMTVYDILTSGRRWSNDKTDEKQNRADAEAILGEVGLTSADLERRPSEFSGGQRQRISIARALLMKPQLLICDEVVSALDVSIQGQILNLLQDIRTRRSLSFLFIAHDLKVACYFCDRIAVMYAGEIMEEADARVLWEKGVHPYTKLLFSSAVNSAIIGESEPNRDNTALKQTVTGENCVFAGRCPHAVQRCYSEKPMLEEIQQGHKIRCFAVTT